MDNEEFWIVSTFEAFREPTGFQVIKKQPLYALCCSEDEAVEVSEGFDEWIMDIDEAPNGYRREVSASKIYISRGAAIKLLKLAGVNRILS